MPVLLPVLALVMAVTPAGATAATAAGPAGYGCTPPFGGPGLVVEAGAVGYDVAGGVSGVAWGVDGTMASGRVVMDLGYRRITLRRTRTSPDVLRGSLRSAVATVGGWSVCGAAHAGGTRSVGDAGRATVLAGGLGLGVSRPITIRGASVLPYAEVRGLGAHASGTVLDIDMDGTGLSMGVEAGASVPVGPVELRLIGSLDGFGPGLGVTPYPARALRLGLGYRF